MSKARNQKAPRKTAYLDCFSGISGDMVLGSLIHLGLELDTLKAELDKLHLDGLEIKTTPSIIKGISGINLEVISRKKQQLRTLPVIEELLMESDLAPDICQRCLQVFSALAAAEATVHGMAIEKVHFHEVGAVDTIVDIVGTLLGFEYLDIESVICSPLPLGRGFVDCAHGKLPLPAPAVVELLAGVPTYGVDLDQELVTPTGAAIAVSLADSFGKLPPMTIEKCGYGVGDSELNNGQPNLLRIICGTTQSVLESQRVEIIETNLDDWNPETFPYLSEQLFDSGALDVSLTPIQMKKGRPGFCLQVIATPATSHFLKELILTESSAIGLRFRSEERRTLVRRKVLVESPWGNVAAKQVETPGGPIVRPEYEECRKIARANRVSLDEVYREIRCGRVIPCTD